MKKIFLLISTVFLGLYAMSQGKIVKTTDPQVAQMEASRKSSAPYSVRFQDGANLKLADAQSILTKYLGLRAGVDELRLKYSDAGTDNITVNRYQQYYKNIKVEHGAYVATAKNGTISFINGDFYTIKNAVTTPQLSEAAALAKALSEISALTYKWQVPEEEAFIKREQKDPTATYYPKGELVFVEDYNNNAELTGKVTLAYKFDIYAQAPLSRDYVYVDAKTGKVLLKDAIIKHLHEKNTAGTPAAETTGTTATTGVQVPESIKAVTAPETTTTSPTVTGTAATRYSGSVTIPTTLVGSSYNLISSLAVDNYPLHTKNMHKTTNYGGATEFTDADNNWTAAEFDNANRDNAALDAHWGAMEVINYWRTRHNRNSYDNNNAVINSYVHYSNAYDNAYWDGVEMTYGDGSNTTGGFTPLTSIDVCGHEIGHAVCSYTANLVYQRESGAMNEGFSDIWGASIEHFADPHETDAIPKSYFLIGEEISQFFSPGFLRSMSAPKTATSPHQPDTYGGTYWINPSVASCPTPNSNTNDNCWVHYNSGVLNHWFYILVSGKTGTNDVGYSYSVTGIGWVDAEKITYLGEQNLASTADYSACRTAMYNAAITLFGACSVQAATVLQAFDAVNVKGAVPQPVLTLTQSVTQQQEGLQVTYTNHVASLCPTQPFTGYFVRDTLPSNVTFVSATNGGTYNAANRVVTFNVTLAGGASADYAFTVSINAGSYFPTVNLFEDNVTGTTIPATWTAASSTANNWVVSQARSYSPPNSYFSVDVPVISNQTLTTTSDIALGATPPNLTFWHWFNTESTYDGGILEISTNGGTTYTYVPTANILSGGYTGTMDASTVLTGKQAWTGTSGGFIKTKVNLASYANQNVRLRFRFSSDNGGNAEGWYVDNIAIKSVATVDIRSTLFNASNVIIQQVDTFTIILPATATNDFAFGTTTATTVSCPATSPAVTIPTTVSGTFVTPIVLTASGVPAGTTVTFAPNPLTPGSSTVATLNNANTLAPGTYAITVTGTAGATVHTTTITYIITATPPVITTQPANQTVCAPGTATFSVASSTAGVTYQWQSATAAAPTVFTNISGATAATYTTGASTGLNGTVYHVIVSTLCGTVTSNDVTLTVNTAPAITTQPTAVTLCGGANATFTVAATGSNLTYQWQVSNSGCTGAFSNITGATSSTLTVNSVTAAMNNYAYKVVVSGSCAPAVTSACALLTVNAPVAIGTQPVDASICYTTAGPNNTSFTVAATGTAATYQWQVSTDGTNYTNLTNTAPYSGVTTNTLNITGATLNMTGYKYRVLISGTCTPAGIYSNVVTLTVLNPVVINADPVAVKTCAGSTASFTVNASGSALSYQWQVSSDGVNYGNLSNGGVYSGVNTATLTVANVTTALNGFSYRAVVTGTPCGIKTTAAALLTVNDNPSVVLTIASNSSINPSTPSQLYTTVSPAGNYTYQYTRNGGATSFTTATVPLSVDLYGTYQVTVTNTATGCFAKSNTVTAKDSASGRVFIYPNPNKGWFQVRYYNAGASTTTRTLNIFDSKGAKVYTKAFPTTAIYERMDVNIAEYAAGTYFVEVRGADGKLLATGKVKKD